jgi:hypothetical protein
MQEDLEQQVAQFLAEEAAVSIVEGGQGLVCFFDEIGAEGAMSLDTVPGAAGGAAESSDDAAESVEST